MTFYQPSQTDFRSFVPSLRCRTYFLLAFILSGLMMTGLFTVLLSQAPVHFGPLFITMAAMFALILGCLRSAVDKCNP